MSQQKLLAQVIQALGDCGIQYMLTGSLVSSLQGEPRSTHDIDIVVAVRMSDAPKLAKAFPPPDFYIDRQSIVEALNTQGMFNLIDTKSGWKVDFWILSEDAFDRSRFSRRISERVMGMEILVSSPEDTILVKLKWANLSGGSEKQFNDALGVYEVQFGDLDMDYLERWVRELGLESLWKRLLSEAETE